MRGHKQKLFYKAPFFGLTSIIFKDYINKRDMSDALSCIASLVKNLNKFDLICGSSGQKTTQKQSKIILSLGIKTFQKF